MLTGSRADLRPLIILAIHTGMRRGELLSLRWANVDFARGLIHVLNSQREKTKSGHSRSIPMNRIARGELLGLQRETGHTEYVFFNEKTQKARTDLKNGFRTACRLAGLDNFRFHDLRHTTATRLADAGIGTRAIMAILGHRSIQTSARYTHATDAGLRRAAEALAQRQTRTVTKVPTIAKQRQEPAAVNY